MVKRFDWLLVCLLFSIGVMAQSGGKQYNSYKGLVMAGYQGWFNTPGDGSGRGWHHYNGRNGFRPGSCSVDLWPEVSEYKKLYKTEFSFADGKPAYVFSSHDESTVDVHFKWMQEYGLDGVFMQRFITEIRNESGLKHFNKVLNSAMKSANKYERAICVMYDLSGMKPGEEGLLLKDIAEIARQYSIKDHVKNPSYLYHNGKPLVTVWGVGFNDNRRYGLKEAERIIDGLKLQGFSVMLGAPTQWRELKRDTIVEFKGQWYAFYHNSALSNHDWLRSICVDKLYHNPDGTIKLVKQTKSTPITVQKKYPFRNPLTGGMNVCMVLDVLNIMSQYFRRQ